VHRCTTFIDTGKLPLASLDQVNPWQRFDHLSGGVGRWLPGKPGRLRYLLNPLFKGI